MTRTSRCGFRSSYMPFGRVSFGDFPSPCEVIAGLTAMLRLLELLKHELGLAVSSKPMNPEMLEVHTAGVHCFAWDSIVPKSCTKEQVLAFDVLVRKLKPFLQHTIWPRSADFAQVQQTWELPINQLRKQYLLLCNRVRSVALRFAQSHGLKLAAPPPRREGRDVPRSVLCAAQTWFSVSAYKVQPVWVNSQAVAICGQHLPDLPPLAMIRVASLISNYIGCLPMKSQELLSLSGCSFLAAAHW